MMKIKNPLTKEYVVTSKYGYRVIKGKRGFHFGVDLVGEGHTICDVKNCFNGTAKVLRSYNSSTGGNTIVIEHYFENRRYVALYCHLRDRYVKEGDTVFENQNIGYMGNTGHSFGAHLHFQLSELGTEQSVFVSFDKLGNLNPEDYL